MQEGHGHDTTGGGDRSPATAPTRRATGLLGGGAVVVVVVLVLAVAVIAGRRDDAAGPDGGSSAGSTVPPPGSTLPPVPPEHTVTVYGADGTFRQLTPERVATPTGHDIGAHSVPGWGFEPGVSAFFTARTSGGRILFATVPQTDNQAWSTMTTMSVGVFDPRDPAGPSFRSLRLPTSAGRESVTTPGVDTGGADVSDLCPVTTPAGPATVGISAVPYKDWDFSTEGRWPAIAVFRDAGGSGPGAVTYDAAASRTPEDLRDNAAGKSAFPTERNRYGTYATTRGLGECDTLPGGHVVASQYFYDELAGEHSGSLVAFTPDGEVTAFLPLENAELRRPVPLLRNDGTTFVVPAGTVMGLSPREVQADPHTTDPRDQRFVVVYDAMVPDPGQNGLAMPLPFALQEFRYDQEAGTIVASSPPVVTDLDDDLRTDDTLLRANSVAYAPDGTLFVARSPASGFDSLVGEPFAVFRPGSLADRPNRDAAWGKVVAPDGVVAPSATPGATITTVRSLTYDPTTDTVLAVGGFDTHVRLFRWQGWDDTRARPVTDYCDVDLGGGWLAKLDPRYPMQIRQGTLDPDAKVLYVPYQGLQPLNRPADNVVLPQYLFALRLDRALADTNRAGSCRGAAPFGPSSATDR